MGAPEVVIAVAGTATALINVAAALRTSAQKDKTQAAALKSARDVDRSLESLERSITSLAVSVDGRFSDSQVQTTKVLDMYQNLVTRVLPPQGTGTQP